MLARLSPELLSENSFVKYVGALPYANNEISFNLRFTRFFGTLLARCSLDRNAEKTLVSIAILIGPGSSAPSIHSLRTHARVFGEQVEVQRCQIHKRRKMATTNPIESHLSTVQMVL